MNNLALELDLIAARLDAKGQGVACGGGWISPRSKCSRGKAKTTSKENLAKTTERRKKLHGLKAEIEADKGKKARDKPALKVLPGGEKSLKDLFAEADRIGSKYQEPGEPTSISAKRAANRILKESGYGQVSDIASGKVRRLKDRSKAPLKARERPSSVGGVSIDSLLLDLELLNLSHA
jgi:hypothetical protein